MLVTFEGIDGSGKSTQIKMLQHTLHQHGFTTLSVREPGGTKLSEHVRTLLLDPEMSIEPFAELLLFSAARAQLVREQIQPALKEGIIVLCDRFYDSTLAYQGAGRGVADLEWLADFQQRVTEYLVPARTYWLDLPIEESLRRRADRAADRMEIVDTAFFGRVVGAYAYLAEQEPHRVCRLDATLSPAQLQEQIWADLKAMVNV